MVIGLLVSCGKKTETILGKDGTNCTVEQKTNSAIIKCDDGSQAEVFNGKDGKSAYDIAVDSGFQGTLVEWLQSLAGQNGTTGQNGQNGLSAYQIAVNYFLHQRPQLS